MRAFQASSRPRALHVWGALGTGGAENWLAQALGEPGELGWDIELCLLAGEEGRFADVFRRRGFRVFHCPLRPRPTFPLRFSRVCRAGRYEAVHSHVLHFSGLTLAAAASAGVPVRIAHAHNDSDGRPGSLARRLYRRVMRFLIARAATTVVGCTRRAAETLTADPARIRVLPYGIDLARFEATSRRRSRAALGLSDSDVVLGHCGRLTAQKNQALLLGAFSRSLCLEPSLVLLIAGDGPLRERLQARAHELGAADRVRFLGLRDDVPRLMTGVFDAFVLPSLHEGLPLALLEAQAAGLPCVVSSAVNPEAVIDRRRVRFVDLEAGAETWAAALAEAAGRKREPLAEARRKASAAGFDAAQSRRGLAAIYRDASLQAAASAGGPAREAA